MDFEKVYSVYWAEDLPKGFYHVVLEVKYFDSFKNKEIIGDVWKGCILGPDNTCVVTSKDHYPAIGSPFYSMGSGKDYRMTVASFKTLEDTITVKEFIDSETLSNDLLDGAKHWIKAFDRDFTKNETYFNVRVNTTLNKVNQTTDQQVVQSLISKNATKIRDLEQQLRELRLIQKGLKKQR